MATPTATAFEAGPASEPASVDARPERQRRALGLTLYNFLSFRGWHTVSLSTNVVAVCGPQGVGKSGILESIGFVVGHDPPRLTDGGAESLINDQYLQTCRRNNREATCIVQLRVAVDAAEIVVQRSLSSENVNRYEINGVELDRKTFQRRLVEMGAIARHGPIVIRRHLEEQLMSATCLRLSALLEQLCGSDELADEVRAGDARVQTLESEGDAAATAAAAAADEVDELQQQSPRHKARLEADIAAHNALECLAKVWRYDERLRELRATKRPGRLPDAERRRLRLKIAELRAKNQHLTKTAEDVGARARELCAESLRFEQEIFQSFTQFVETAENRQQLLQYRTDQIAGQKRLLEACIREAQEEVEHAEKQLALLNEKYIKFMRKHGQQPLPELPFDVLVQLHLLETLFRKEYSDEINSLRKLAQIHTQRRRAHLLKRQLYKRQRMMDLLKPELRILQRRLDALRETSRVFANDARLTRVELAERIADFEADDRKRWAQYDELTRKREDVLGDNNGDEHQQQHQELQLQRTLEIESSLWLHSNPQVVGILSKLVRPKKRRYMAAFCNVLGGHLHSVVVKVRSSVDRDADDLLRPATDHVFVQRRPPLQLLPLPPEEADSGRPPATPPPDVLQQQDDVMSFHTICEVDPKLPRDTRARLRRLVFRLTERVLYCDDSVVALKILDEHNTAYIVVNADGDIMRRPGVLVSGQTHGDYSSPAGGPHIAASPVAPGPSDDPGTAAEPGSPTAATPRRRRPCFDDANECQDEFGFAQVAMYAIKKDEMFEVMRKYSMLQRFHKAVQQVHVRLETEIDKTKARLQRSEEELQTSRRASKQAISPLAISHRSFEEARGIINHLREENLGGFSRAFDTPVETLLRHIGTGPLEINFQSSLDLLENMLHRIRSESLNAAARVDSLRADLARRDRDLATQKAYLDRFNAKVAALREGFKGVQRQHDTNIGLAETAYVRWITLRQHQQATYKALDVARRRLENDRDATRLAELERHQIEVMRISAVLNYLEAADPERRNRIAPDLMTLMDLQVDHGPIPEHQRNPRGITEFVNEHIRDRASLQSQLYKSEVDSLRRVASPQRVQAEHRRLAEEFELLELLHRSAKDALDRNVSKRAKIYTTFVNKLKQKMRRIYRLLQRNRQATLELLQSPDTEPADSRPFDAGQVLHYKPSAPQQPATLAAGLTAGQADEVALAVILGACSSLRVPFVTLDDCDAFFSLESCKRFARYITGAPRQTICSSYRITTVKHLRRTGSFRMLGLTTQARLGFKQVFQFCSRGKDAQEDDDWGRLPTADCLPTAGYLLRREHDFDQSFRTGRLMCAH